jgi:hypothetical protein
MWMNKVFCIHFFETVNHNPSISCLLLAQICSLFSYIGGTKVCILYVNWKCVHFKRYLVLWLLFFNQKLVYGTNTHTLLQWIKIQSVMHCCWVCFWGSQTWNFRNQHLFTQFTWRANAIGKGGGIMILSVEHKSVAQFCSGSSMFPWMICSQRIILVWRWWCGGEHSCFPKNHFKFKLSWILNFVFKMADTVFFVLIILNQGKNSFKQFPRQHLLGPCSKLVRSVSWEFLQLLKYFLFFFSFLTVIRFELRAFFELVRLAFYLLSHASAPFSFFFLRYHLAF